jgi:hypothetical protein
MKVRKLFPPLSDENSEAQEIFKVLLGRGRYRSKLVSKPQPGALYFTLVKG